MTTFVILAAGKGTRIGRIGESLHKALIPLAGVAMLTHQIRLAPPNAKIVVAVGYLAEQVKGYVELAHPHADITFIEVDGWDLPGAGPGASLYACKDQVDGDLYFTSCDTLWHQDNTLWQTPTRSWVAVSPMPPGSQPARWCRFAIDEFDGDVTGIIDKSPHSPNQTSVYTGLAHIAEEHLEVFWQALHLGELHAGERQVSSGLQEVLEEFELHSRKITWIDTGDEQSYRMAVARFDGYDWSKIGQATYVLPQEGRVVKFNADHDAIVSRFERHCQFTGGVPKIIGAIDGMLAYQYIPGTTVYRASEVVGVDMANRVAAWYKQNFTRQVVVDMDEARFHAERFYRDKTYARIEMLPPDLRRLAEAAVAPIDWERLAWGVTPVVWHGDLNYGNIIYDGHQLYGIDWREDFDGVTEWGDARYDVAKLLGGCYLHWEWAQQGMMRPWVAGAEHAAIFRKLLVNDQQTLIIGGLTFINSAPLHAPPLDEVLVSRGINWLSEGQ